MAILVSSFEIAIPLYLPAVKSYYKTFSF